MTRARWQSSAVAVLGALLAACATDSAPVGTLSGSSGLVTSGASTLNGTVGVQYPNVTFSVEDSTPGALFYWTVSGSLPPGLTVTPANNATLSNTLVLSGTPTTAGQFPFQITVHTSDHSLLISAASQVVTIAGAGGSPVVIALPFTWIVNVADEEILGVIGGQPLYTWSATNLPPGVTLNQTEGKLSGTVTSVGSYPINVTVTDSAGNQGNGTVTLTVISLATYQGTWTGIVQGGPFTEQRLSLLLNQSGLAAQATLDGLILASPSQPLQFTYDTTPGFVGINKFISQINWHLVCLLNDATGDLDCAVHDGLGGNSVNATAVLKNVSQASQDTTVPTVASTTPANGATGVTASQVTVVFNELMSGTGGTAITLSGGSGTVGIPSYADTTTDPASRTLRIPLSGLQDNTSYTVTLNPSGQTGFFDLAGNPLATTSISFTTAAVVANNPPTANPDSYTTLLGAPLQITLEGSDPEGGALTYTVVNPPATGTLTPSGTTTTGDRTYTPAVAGPVSFTFIVTDPLGSQSSPATINITVQQPPVAQAQGLAIMQNTSAAITLEGTAEPGATITAYTIVPGSGPTNGTLVPGGSGSSHTYTPNTSFIGTDRFTFTVTDSRGLVSAPATVTIVVSLTEPPVAFDQTIIIGRRTGTVAAQWAIFLSGSSSAVRFKIVRWPTYQDYNYVGICGTTTDPTIPQDGPCSVMDYVGGRTYQTGWTAIDGGTRKPTVTPEVGTSSVVDLQLASGLPSPQSTGNITVTGSPYAVVYTATICHFQDFSQDSFDFVAIDANGVESAPATVTILPRNQCVGTH
ncbi:MAG: Ig-like domain-containing protein [Nitrospirota bacterium]